METNDRTVKSDLTNILELFDKIDNIWFSSGDTGLDKGKMLALVEIYNDLVLGCENLDNTLKTKGTSASDFEGISDKNAKNIILGLLFSVRSFLKEEKDKLETFLIFDKNEVTHQ